MHSTWTPPKCPLPSFPASAIPLTILGLCLPQERKTGKENIKIDSWMRPAAHLVQSLVHSGQPDTHGKPASRTWMQQPSLHLSFPATGESYAEAGDCRISYRHFKDCRQLSWRNRRRISYSLPQTWCQSPGVVFLQLTARIRMTGVVVQQYLEGTKLGKAYILWLFFKCNSCLS